MSTMNRTEIGTTYGSRPGAAEAIAAVSEANTARAVGLPRRSWASWSVLSGGPSSEFFTRYDNDSSTMATGGVGFGCRNDGSCSVTVTNPSDHDTCVVAKL